MPQQDEYFFLHARTRTSFSSSPAGVISFGRRTKGGCHVPRRLHSDIYASTWRHAAAGQGLLVLGSDQQALADRFSSAWLKGGQRYEGAAWSIGPSGVPLLTESLAIVECQAEEIMERYSHGIVVGRLLSMELSHCLSTAFSVYMGSLGDPWITR